MKKILFTCLILATTVSVAYCFKKKTTNILVFSYTQKYRHKSIEPGLEAIKKIGKEKDYHIIHSENVADFNDDFLKEIDVVLFLNPTGTNVFSDMQKNAFKKFINNGGGFVGVHAATDFCFEWEWYGKLVGAFFINHPKIQQAKLDVLDKKHLATKHLPNPWMHTDEWYNFRDFNNKVKVLLSVDEKSYTGGTMPGFHPISWFHKYDGGKAFYTALGHTIESFSDDLFLKHLEGGIKSVIPKKKR